MSGKGPDADKKTDKKMEYEKAKKHEEDKMMAGQSSTRRKKKE